MAAKARAGRTALDLRTGYEPPREHVVSHPELEGLARGRARPPPAPGKEPKVNSLPAIPDFSRKWPSCGANDETEKALDDLRFQVRTEFVNVS